MSAMPLTDAIFLLAETREQPIHVGGLHLYRKPPDAEPDHVAALYRSLLDYEGELVRRLQRRPVRPLGGLGPWSWQPDPSLDREYHVRHSALPHPGRIRELLALVSRLHGTLLDRSRPLWEAHLIEGLADGRFATYTKVHHAVMDGVSAMRLLEKGLTTDPDARDLPPPLAHRSRPSRGGEDGGGSPLRAAGALVGAGVEGVKGALGAGDAALRSFARSFADQAATFPFRAPTSMLNVPISGSRRFAAQSWEVERLRAVGKALGGTLNDVVLAMSAGALRSYLKDQGALPDDPLVAMVPVSLREDEDDEGAGNAVGLILCNLGTHLADPVERFELIHSSAQQGKLRLEGLNQTGILMLSAMSFAPLGLGPLYRFEPLRRPPFNIIISNVPGPSQPLYWNGAALDGVFPASIPSHGQALNITCTSYAGKMGFGLVGCRQSVPSLQRLLDHLESSLGELEAAAT
jgi:diacylglycerol O-acyltransferase / wax synthase